MRPLIRLASVAVLFVATSALADDKKPVDPDKKICRREAVTGSIMGGDRICHTRAEWKQIDDANAENALRIRDNRRTGTGSFGT